MKRLAIASFAFTLLLACTGPLRAQVQGQWTTTGTMQSTRELNAQVLLKGGTVLSVRGG